MQAVQDTLPSISLVANLPSGRVKTVTTNMLFPIRSAAHVPWAEPTRPLVVVPTLYDEPPVYANNPPGFASPTSNGNWHVTPGNRILRWLERLISRVWSFFSGKVEDFKKRIASVYLSCISCRCP